MDFVAVPTVFTGNSVEDFEKWVKSFERVAKANDWPNDRLVNIMPAYISGRAGDLLDKVDASVDLSILIGDTVLIPSALFRSHVELRS